MERVVQGAEERERRGAPRRRRRRGRRRRGRALSERARWAALLLASALGCGAPPSATERASTPPLTYRLRYDGGGIDVAIDVPPDMPAAWAVPDWHGSPTQVTCEPGAATVALEGGALRLPPGVRRLRYRYALGADAGLKGGAGGHGGHVLAGARYLLKPVSLRRDAPVAIEADADVLLPWALAGGRAQLRGRDLLWTGFHAFGARRRSLTHAQGQLELAILPGGDPARDDRLEAWIRTAWEELLTCAPRFPAPRLAVTLVPLVGGRRVGFGQILRSEPPTVAIYVGTEVSEQTLREDWVAVHELSHALHPRLEPTAPWLSEGLATYWQVVARIRSGRVTPARGWQQLAWGVRTGRDGAGGRTLEQLSERMHAWHAYRPVYWGGALAALELDLAIREASAGAQTLDDALGAIRVRGGAASLAQIAAAVDAAAGAPVYEAVTARALTGTAALAAGTERLGELGIVEGAGRLARLDEAAALAAARQALERVGKN